MFYILSKIFAFLIIPFNWIVILLLIALKAKNKWIRLKYLKYAIFLLLFFTNPLIHHFIFNCYEVKNVEINNIPQNEVGILLGGYADTDIEDSDSLLQIDQAGNRLIAAIELYKQKKINKILISGGNGSLFEKNKNEATLVRRFLLRMSIDSIDILTDSLSRNTYENAVYSKQLLIEKYSKIPSATLITSAFHMNRAEKVFNKIGINCIPFSCDKKINDIDFNLNETINPDPLLLKDWQYLIKEWIGLIAYSLNGYL